MGSSQRRKPPPNLLVIHTVLPLALFAYSSHARIRPLTHRGRAELDGCDRVQLSASRSREARPDSVSPKPELELADRAAAGLAHFPGPCYGRLATP